MTTFDDRERAFETKFAHDADMQFRAAARRNKYLGLWIAERLGLSADEAETYAGSVIAADLEEAGDEDVIRKVMGDIETRGVSLSEADVRTKLAELQVKAKEELMKDAG